MINSIVIRMGESFSLTLRAQQFTTCPSHRPRTCLFRMAHLLRVLLAAVVLQCAWADQHMYTVTWIPCSPTSTCPQGNPIAFNQTFALNGTVQHTLILKVNDEVTFKMDSDVPSHPFVVCQRSATPNFCFGVGYTDQMKPPMTMKGNVTTVKFTNGGSYFYGSLNEPGMGGAISVFPAGVVKNGLVVYNRAGIGHDLSICMLLVAISALLVALRR